MMTDVFASNFNRNASKAVVCASMNAVNTAAMAMAAILFTLGLILRIIILCWAG